MREGDYEGDYLRQLERRGRPARRSPRPASRLWEIGRWLGVGVTITPGGAGAGRGAGPALSPRCGHSHITAEHKG